MGVEIVKAATHYGRRLSGNAYKVLVAMSLSALDKPTNGRPASLYWGGWDALAIALGYDNADRGSAGHNAVARAIRELKNGRHVTPMNDARTGIRQSYMVHPGGLPGGNQGEQNAHAEGEQNAHTVREQNAHPSVSKTLTPRKEQGSKGLTQDINLIQQGRPQTASQDAAESDEKSRPHKFQGQPSSDCVLCGKGYQNRAAHPLHLLSGFSA